MDRDQRSRQQKAAPPRRSMGSRVGLQKKTQPPPQQKPPARSTARTRRPAQNNPQKPGYRPTPTRPRPGHTGGN